MNYILKSSLRLAILSCLFMSIVSLAYSAGATGQKDKAVPTSALAPADLKLLSKLDETYRSQSMSMKVARTTKVPDLGIERTTSGTLLVSKGRLRMELDGDQKSLLVINKKNLWAVTYPDADFGGRVQVIRADVNSKTGRSQSLLVLLSQGGFQKFFIASGAEKQKDGEVLFFLSPKEDQVDFKRAQIKVSADGTKLTFLKYWDAKGNEVEMAFSDFKKESSIDSKKFEYTPPADADIISL